MSRSNFWLDIDDIAEFYARKNRDQIAIFLLSFPRERRAGLRSAIIIFRRLYRLGLAGQDK